MEDIALNQMLEYPSLSEEERKELEWLPEKLKETVDILCERADGPFWCDEQWIISEQFENEKEYRKFLRTGIRSGILYSESKRDKII